MFCLKCDYDLQGCRGPVCPECGQPFDAANPHTYARRSSSDERLWPWKLGLLLFMALLGIMLIALAAWLMLLCTGAMTPIQH